MPDTGSSVQLAGWPGPGRSLRGGRRLTLVELLVAVSLGMILIGVITFVWLQSTKIFTTTVNRLETYQRLRTIMDVLERDLANTNRTIDMEFYEDEDGDGHRDDNELVKRSIDSGDTQSAQVFRRPRAAADPLFEEEDLVFTGEEFGLEGFPADDENYIHAPIVLSPAPYNIGAGYTDHRYYWRDEIYVRTFAMVDGINHPALVHYRLVHRGDTDEGEGRSALRRRVWYLDEDGEIISAAHSDRDRHTDHSTILTHGVADLKFAFYFKPSQIEGDGRWYHVGNQNPHPSDDGDDRVGEAFTLDQDRGFLPAMHPDFGLSAQHADDGQFGGLNVVSFHYEGNARVEQLEEIGGAVFRAIEGEVTDDLTGYDLDDTSSFDFPGVRPGDKVYVFGATDDDPQQAGAAGREAGNLFRDRLLTVDTIFTDASEAHAAIKFREPVYFFRLGNTWLGAEGSLDERTITQDESDGDAGLGPPRTIRRSFNVHYRVGFLPAAFMVRLSCDDRYNRKVLPMERVIRLLQQ